MKAFNAKQTAGSNSACFAYVKVHPETWAAIKKQYSRLQKRFDRLIHRVEHFYTVELCAASERIRNLKNGSYKLRVTDSLRIAFRLEHTPAGTELLFGRIVPHQEGVEFHHSGVADEFRELVVFSDNWETTMTVDDATEDPEPYFSAVYRQWDPRYLDHLKDNPDADLSWFLDEEQREIACMAGPVLLSGSAGSGKTTIALYRLIMGRKAAEEKQAPLPRQLYVTLSESLRDYASNLFDVLCPPSGSRPEFLTVDELCQRYAPDEFDPQKRLTLAKFKERSFLDEEERAAFGDLDLIWREIRGVIKGSRTLISGTDGRPRTELEYDEYLKEASDLLFTTPKKVYEAYRCVKKQKRKNGLWDDLDLAQMAYAGALASEGRMHAYDEIIVDEAQDLTNFHVALLWRLCPNESGLFLAGDTQQAIHPSRFSWQDCLDGLYAQGRPAKVLRLTNNYRCPESVVQWANAFADWRRQALSEKEALAFLPLVQGEPVYRMGFDYRWPRDHFRFSEQLMVIVPHDGFKREAADIFGDGFVFTVAEAKGLERDYIILWRCIEPDFPLWQKLGWSDSIGPSCVQGIKPFVQYVLNCWNIAITRTKTSLFVVDTHYPEWSVFLRGNFANERDSRARLSEVLTLEGGDYGKDADELESRGLFRQAGWKYKLDQNWLKAATCFKKVEAWAETAECFEKVGDTHNAQVYWHRAAVVADERRDWADAASAYWKCGKQNDAQRCKVTLEAKLRQLDDAQRAKRWRDAANVLADLKRDGEAAEHYERAQMFTEAAKYYEASSNWPSAAKCHDQLLDWSEALRCYERAGEWAEAARCAELVKDWVKAAFYFEKVGSLPEAALNFEREKLLPQAIQLFERSDHWVEAGRCYWAMANVKDLDSAKRREAWQNAGVCYELVPDWHRAGESYRLSKSWADAARCYERAMSWEDAGECYDKDNQLVKAAEAYERAGRWSTAGTVHLKLLDPTRAATCFLKAQDWFQAGRCLQQLEDWEEAGRCFALSNHWLLSARMYEKAGRLDEAAPKFELANEYQIAAQFYEKLSIWPKAAACYEEAGDWFHAAVCHEKLENWAQAGDGYMQARSWANAKRCLTSSQDWFNVGVVCDQLGEHEEGARAYARVGAWQEAANNQKRLGHWEEAIELLSKIPNWAEMAECHLHLEHWDEAAHLFKAVRMFGQAAECFEKLNWWTEAAYCHMDDKNLLAAARCYELSGTEYVRAGTLFLDERQYEAAARCLELGAAWREAADCYAKVGKNLQAAKCYEEAKLWKEAGQYYKRELAWESAADMFANGEEWDEAARAYVYCQAWNQAGAAFMKEQSFGLAAKYFEKAGNAEGLAIALRSLKGPLEADQ